MLHSPVAMHQTPTRMKIAPTANPIRSTLSKDSYSILPADALDTPAEAFRSGGLLVSKVYNYPYEDASR